MFGHILPVDESIYGMLHYGIGTKYNEENPLLAMTRKAGTDLKQ